MAELLVVPIRNNDQFAMARYRRLLAPSPTLEMIAFEANVASRFAELRAAHRVKQPDAIHLALAASAKANAFVTADSRLSTFSVPGVGVIGDLTFPLP